MVPSVEIFKEGGGKLARGRWKGFWGRWAVWGSPHEASGLEIWSLPRLLRQPNSSSNRRRPWKLEGPRRPRLLIWAPVAFLNSLTIFLLRRPWDAGPEVGLGRCFCVITWSDDRRRIVRRRKLTRFLLKGTHQCKLPARGWNADSDAIQTNQVPSLFSPRLGGGPPCNPSILLHGLMEIPA